MIVKYTLYVGLNDKKEEIQLVSNTVGFDTIEGIVFSNGCDATYTFCKGNYTHENGSRVKENTIKVEMLFFNDFDGANRTVHNIVDAIKTALNQETVAVECEKVNSELW